jgi:hypothetical protein
MAYFEILSLHSPGMTEEKVIQDNWCQYQIEIIHFLNTSQAQPSWSACNCKMCSVTSYSRVALITCVCDN